MNGFLIDDFQASTGKKYLNIDLYYVQYGLNYTNQYLLPTEDCGNTYPQWQGYICIDFKNISDEMKTMVYSDSLESTIEIQFSSCAGEQNCSSEQETLDMLIKQTTFLEVYIVTQQYNYTSGQFQQSYVMEIYQLDDLLVVYGSFDGYGYITFQLDQTFCKQEYQFPMITEILSQFVSLFNILMFFGVVASNFSRKFMLQNLCELYLKEQFKCTAVNLIGKQECDSQKNDKSSIINIIKHGNKSYSNQGLVCCIKILWLRL
ncbi:transmembrane protein, putative (macronuclear) [Tetrahymena thermophila SB210]|uniref:Transmembrane protein, putative n=1 Tax=Tetrahymena thermophila (strain SB210) TaxID=312017 RepID=I7M8E7_TETTS|nr:transmembrane protein, putative [Tetrahymena thermophila SB210]EAR97939.2 transmembrane protein, putative [Tetrahymena thermophila SB210]|eukprot:XP_001018184.2 transmembrane protein, putative [Tetrahymena thermophila SB210]